MHLPWTRMKVAVVFSIASVLSAGPPTLRELYPRGAQRGKTFTLYLKGEGLTAAAQIKTTLPASLSRLTLSKDPLSESNQLMRGSSVLPLLVSLKPDTPTGFYP